MGTAPAASFLELKTPPVALVVLVAVAMLLACATAHRFSFHFLFPAILSIALALLGFISCTLGFFEFKRAKTTVNPTRPEASSSLVTSGIYRHTRNPMYLGFLLGLFGCAFATSNLLSFFFLPAFVLYMNRFQIQPEERALAALFGEQFENYRSRVRRWL